MNRPGVVAGLLALAACGVHYRPEHRWTGQLTAPNCPPTKAVALLREGLVTFAPDEGTWVLSGTAGPKTLVASRERPTADHKIYKTDLRAEWTETTLRGTYTTPECTYQVNLTSY